MKLSVSAGADPNYLATVVKIPTINPHPNAERLELVEIFGNTVVIGKGSYTTGELVVYFPVESAISTRFLSWANLLEKPDMNADGKSKGFFQTKGRVRAVSLRGVPSQGFLFKISELARYYNIPEDTFKLNDCFDIIGEDQLVTKYIKGTSGGSSTSTPSTNKKVPKVVNAIIGVFPRSIRKPLYSMVNSWYIGTPKPSTRLLDGQFQFHYKTEHLGKNIFLVHPNDEIVVTEKLHGTSAVFGNLLAKKKFNIGRYILKSIGVDVDDTEYTFVYSSRSRMKNKHRGKFTDDVWGSLAEEVEEDIPPGYTIYGEIVGYTSGNKTIQKNYDYGCAPGDCELYVYRITNTTEDGEVRELRWFEIEEFCQFRGWKTVPVHYYGPAKDMFVIPSDANWENAFLAELKKTYLDRQCSICTTGVVNEGVVLRNENNESRRAFKFKSPKFVLGESEARDKGEEDMEEES